MDIELFEDSSIVERYAVLLGKYVTTFRTY